MVVAIVTLEQPLDDLLLAIVALVVQSVLEVTVMV